jgi:putative copper export protein
MAFLVRWLHVSSASFLLGGALLLFILFQVSKRRGADRQTMLDLMQAYEWASWGAIGLIVMTGVGNLGHFGAGLPARDSDWGRDFTLKLALVGFFLAFSAVRSLSVVLVQTQPEPSRRLPPALQGMYGATALFIVAILGVAVALAHF